MINNDKRRKNDLIFNALIREATFTKELLCSGATQIRKANYATPGIYAQAFSALSIGLERIGKLCLMLDHYTQNNGQFPDFDYLKNKIGHKLVLLHERALDIADQRKVKFSFISSVDQPVHQLILRVLHNYADGDRYSNINILIDAKQKNDPISEWSSSVDKYIFDNIVANRRKKIIVQNATETDRMMSHLGTVYHTAETGEEINSYFDGVFRTGVFEAVAPYRQLYVIQIIRYWAELLSELGVRAQSLDRQEIPFLFEIFGGFCNSDSYIKSRKSWNF